VEIKDTLKLSNRVLVEHRNAAGELLYRSEGDNLVVNGGFDWLCAQLADAASASAVMKWIGVCSDTGAVGPTDSSLTSEYADADADGLDRAAATYAHTGGTKVFTLSHTFTKGAGANKVAGKTGLFNQLAVGGTMIAAYLIPTPPTLASTDTLLITWTITLS
jgi:hypothetical protein